MAVATCSYVCQAVNAKHGTNFIPSNPDSPANCEYLLRLIDLVNRGSTSYGTSQWATQFVIKEAGVDYAVNALQKKTKGLSLRARTLSYGL